MKARVIKEHKGLKNTFPIGFETDYYFTYTDKDFTSEGFYTHIRTIDENKKFVSSRQYVEPKTISKGSFKSVIFKGFDGKEYDGDHFYRITGRSFTEFIEKIGEEKTEK